MILGVLGKAVMRRTAHFSTSVFEKSSLIADTITCPNARFLKKLSGLTVLLLTGVVASAQSNLVLFISSPDDYIGAGRSYVTEDLSQFSVSGDAATISVGAFGFGFTFAGP